MSEKLAFYALSEATQVLNQDISMDGFRDLALSLNSNEIATNASELRKLQPDMYRIRYQIDMLKRAIDKYNTSGVDLSDFIVYNVIMIVHNTFEEGLLVQSIMNVLDIKEESTTQSTIPSMDLDELDETIDNKLADLAKILLKNLHEHTNTLKTDTISELTGILRTHFADLKGHVTRRTQQDGLSKSPTKKALDDPTSSSSNKNKE